LAGSGNKAMQSIVIRRRLFDMIENNTAIFEKNNYKSIGMRGRGSFAHPTAIFKTNNEPAQ
jgi:hypothetical protein